MKTFLSATAATALLTGAAFAQVEGGAFAEVQVMPGQDYLASDLMGRRVYASEAQMEIGVPVFAGAATEWDDIGQIGDFVISAEGELEAIVLDIGGFLGIGVRNVAVKWAAIQPVVEDDDPTDVFLVVNASRAMIEGAPDFLGQAPTAAMTTDTGATMTGDETVIVAEGTDTTPVPDAEIGTQDVVVSTDDVVAEDVDVTVVEAEIVEEGELEVVGAETVDPAATRLAGERTMLRTPMFEREGFQPAMMDDLTSEELTGMRLYGADDEDIGEIKDLVMAADGQSIELAVLDIGGFLGLGERQIAVTLDELQILRDPNGLNRAYIDATQEELEAQPEYGPSL